jgi:tRNA(Ile)-lysidine synthase
VDEPPRSAVPAPPGEAALPALFESLTGRRGLVLAVSGGSDSLALLHLFARWRDALARTGAAAPPAVVATVDHRLRPEAAAEAAAVAELAGAHGLPHATLVWEGAKPAADLQAAARAARYRLLAGFARQNGLDAVVTAHTRDDQAETLLLRLSHGSGLAGLAAMRPARPLGGGVTLLRPLLATGRAELRACLVDAGIRWSEDPSNTDPRFARPRLRALTAPLADAGLTPAMLATAARRLARADAAIEAATDGLAATALARHPGGFAAIDLAALAAAPEEVALRLMARAIGEIGGEPYGPRLERLERLLADLSVPSAGGGRFRRTLGGAVVERRGPRLLVHREAGRNGLPSLSLAPGDTLAWDGRFDASLARAAPSRVTIAALGTGARGVLGRAATAWPASLLATVPAAFAGGAVVAVPAFDVFADGPWRGVVRIAPRGRRGCVTLSAPAERAVNLAEAPARPILDSEKRRETAAEGPTGPG